MHYNEKHGSHSHVGRVNHTLSTSDWGVIHFSEGVTHVFDTVKTMQWVNRDRKINAERPSIC